MSNNNINMWFKDLMSEVFNELNIKAINIGFIETDTSYTLYAIGACEYDYEDDDWACSEDFEPLKKYLPTCYLVKDIKWNVFKEKMIEELSAIIRRKDISIPDNIQYITCGFDDGELSTLYKK